LFVLVQPMLINPSTSRANRLRLMDEKLLRRYQPLLMCIRSAGMGGTAARARIPVEINQHNPYASGPTAAFGSAVQFARKTKRQHWFSSSHHSEQHNFPGPVLQAKSN
jgi:hypothetical protein